MNRTRMEAFSDGVLAIIITIMVLELKAPRGGELAALWPLAPVFFSYVLSFVYIAIYWNNHHHMLHTVHHVTGGMLWANLHLLFWLSLFPITTAWMGENDFAPAPTALYGFVLLMAGIAYWLLQQTIMANEGDHSVLRRAVGRDVKGKSSIALYLIAVLGASRLPLLAHAIYVFVAAMWLVPDRRIENALPREPPS